MIKFRVNALRKTIEIYHLFMLTICKKNRTTRITTSILRAFGSFAGGDIYSMLLPLDKAY